MKVWVICGYCDQVAPFFAAKGTCSHLFLNDDLNDNLPFAYNPSGHMFYRHEPSPRQFRVDAEAWFEGCVWPDQYLSNMFRELHNRAVKTITDGLWAQASDDIMAACWVPSTGCPRAKPA